MIKASTEQYEIIINIYAPNTGLPNYIKPTLLHLNRDARDFNTLLSSIDKSTRKKSEEKKTDINQYYRPNG